MSPHHAAQSDSCSGEPKLLENFVELDVWDSVLAHPKALPQAAHLWPMYERQVNYSSSHRNSTWLQFTFGKTCEKRVNMLWAPDRATKSSSLSVFFVTAEAKKLAICLEVSDALGLTILNKIEKWRRFTMLYFLRPSSRFVPAVYVSITHLERMRPSDDCKK